MDNEVKISDYGIFDDAVAVSESYTNTIEEFKDACRECNSVFRDESVFMGPVRDNFVSSVNDVNSNSDSMVSDNNKINDYLKSVSGNYQSADSQAREVVTNISSSPSSLSSSSTSSLSTGTTTSKSSGLVDSLNGKESIVSNI